MNNLVTFVKVNKGTIGKTTLIVAGVVVTGLAARKAIKKLKNGKEMKAQFCNQDEEAPSEEM